MSIHTLLLIISFVLALLAAIGVPAARLNLLAAAFAVYVLAALLGTGALS